MSITFGDNVNDRLNKLLGSVIISQGGVVPHIAQELLPSKPKVCMKLIGSNRGANVCISPCRN